MRVLDVPKAAACTYEEPPAATLCPRGSANLWRLIYSDFRRYRVAGARTGFGVIAFTQGFWASSVYRVSHWALTHQQLAFLRGMVQAGCVVLQKVIELVAGISIPATSNIGPGIYIGHFGGIFIDAECQVGRNCNLSQGVTLGQGGRGEARGVPVLGDRVHVGAHAVVLGKITIGDDAVIGAGAVVMNSVPPCGVALGNPARVVSTEGSFEFVHYDEMQDDPARRRALEGKRLEAAGEKERHDPCNTIDHRDRPHRHDHT